MNKQKITFNLLDNEWIPCSMIDGTFRKLGINQVIQDAFQIRDVNFQNPLAQASIYRLLLAILHRNFGPENKSEWIRIYKQKCWDDAILSPYFKRWNDRFELFNEPENRFYQVKITPKDSSPVTILDLSRASGNNKTLFDHTWDTKDPQMEVSEVASLLLAVQNFSPSTKAGRDNQYPHSSLASGIVMFLKGKNLFESLMLNFIQYNNSQPWDREGRDDIPFWEHDNKEIYFEKIRPDGYLDYLTWQSRKLWLEGVHQENGNILVQDIYVSPGLDLKKFIQKDPQKAYKTKVIRKRKEYHPLVSFEQDKKVWRELETLLQLNNSMNTAINWISRIKRTFPTSPKLEIFGFTRGTTAAAIKAWHRVEVPLSSAIFDPKKNPDFLSSMGSCISHHEEIISYLIELLKKVAREYLYQNKDIKPDWIKVTDLLATKYQVEIQYWNRIEPYFYLFLEELYDAPEPRVKIVIEKWTLKAIKVATEIFNSIQRDLRNQYEIFKILVKNRGLFYYKLNELKNKLR